MKVYLVLFTIIFASLVIPVFSAEESGDTERAYSADERPEKTAGDTAVDNVSPANKEIKITIKRLADGSSDTTIETYDNSLVIKSDSEHTVLDLGGLKTKLEDINPPDISDVDTNITMIIKKEDGKVVIKARGDKEALKEEVNTIVKEIQGEDGAIAIRELDNGYDLTVTPDTE